MTNLMRLLSLLLLTLCISCDNVNPFDIDDVDFGNPEIGVPLINSTFFIADLGVNPENNTEVISDNEGRVTLRYSDQIEPIPITRIFPAEEDQVLLIESNPEAFMLPFHDIDIRKGIFKDSYISFDISNPTSEPLSITVSIPELSNSGSPFSESYLLAPGQEFQSPQIDLSEMNMESNGSLNPKL